MEAKTQDDKSYYEKLVDVDIFYYLRGPLQRGSIWLDPSDKENIKFRYRRVVPWDVPWIYVKNHPDTRCFLWSEILFEHFKNAMSNPPTGCQNCWKVVVKPRTLQELFLLEKAQRELDYPCKCGIEVRSYVHGHYGGYFYNRSLEEGLDKLDIVREKVHKDISPDIPVLLKRGCTEMEIFYGDADKWEITPDVQKWEDILFRYFDPHTQDSKIDQLDIIQNYVHRRWIDYAYTQGDPTYKLFTNGKNLSIDYRTYERENYNGKRQDE